MVLHDFYVLSDGNRFACHYDSGAVWLSHDINDATQFSSQNSAEQVLNEGLRKLEGFSVFGISYSFEKL